MYVCIRSITIIHVDLLLPFGLFTWMIIQINFIHIHQNKSYPIKYEGIIELFNETVFLSIPQMNFIT